MNTACGSPCYVAPEILQAKTYGTAVDMWSIGVVTYLLLCGFPPFYGNSVTEVFEMIINGNYYFPKKAWDKISIDGAFVIQMRVVTFPLSVFFVCLLLPHCYTCLPC